jgi:flagellar motor switch protein FliG
MQQEIEEKCCQYCFLVGFTNKKCVKKQFFEIEDLTSLSQSVICPVIKSIDRECLMTGNNLQA